MEQWHMGSLVNPLFIILPFTAKEREMEGRNQHMAESLLHARDFLMLPKHFLP